MTHDRPHLPARTIVLADQPVPETLPANIAALVEAAERAARGEHVGRETRTGTSTVRLGAGFGDGGSTLVRLVRRNAALGTARVEIVLRDRDEDPLVRLVIAEHGAAAGVDDASEIVGIAHAGAAVVAALTDPGHDAAALDAAVTAASRAMMTELCAAASDGFDDVGNARADHMPATPWAAAHSCARLLRNAPGPLPGTLEDVARDADFPPVVKATMRDGRGHSMDTLTLWRDTMVHDALHEPMDPMDRLRGLAQLARFREGSA